MSSRPWISIIIPAHNEGNFLRPCLDSFISQTRRPDELVLVDDNSTDNTAEIAKEYAALYPWITYRIHLSEPGHSPGAKVIRAFSFGLEHISPEYTHIGKFDADVVLPSNYFERLLLQFEVNPGLGMCSGLIFIEKENQWIYEPIADTTHVRGPVKFYSRACFEALGGLKQGIGWDTADVLLARYHGLEVKTLKDLKVKHLRPTGTAYSRENAFKQGQALFALRYGLVLSVLASLKMAWKRKSILLPFHHLQGFIKARHTNIPLLLSDDAAKFARTWRWQQIRKKLF